MSFFDKYVKYVIEITDTPTEFIEASAFHLLSSILSRYFFLPGISMHTRPNVMFLMSSIPGRTRRSTLTDIDRRVYKLSYKHLVETNDEDKIEQLVSDSIIEEGSVEGIMDGIIDYRKKATGPYNIDYQSTEFGDVLKMMSGKSKTYNRGVARIISKTYCGEGGKMNLSTRGGKKNRYLLSGTYSTMFAGMQKAQLYIDPYHAEQGLLRRIIMVTRTEKRYKEYWDPFRDSSRDIEAHSDQIKQILDKALPIYKKRGQIPMHLAPKVISKINKIDKERALAVDEDDSYLNIIRQSDAEHITKLSALLSINDFTPIDSSLNVRVEHYQKAKEFFDKATKGNNEIFENIGVINQPIYTNRDQISKVLRYIPRLKYITNRELLQKTGLTNEKLEPIIETLKKQEKIKFQNEPYRGGVSVSYTRA